MELALEAPRRCRTQVTRSDNATLAFGYEWHDFPQRDRRGQPAPEREQSVATVGGDAPSRRA